MKRSQRPKLKFCPAVLLFFVTFHNFGFAASPPLNLVGQTSVKWMGFVSICDVRLYANPDFQFEDWNKDEPIKLEVTYRRNISADRLIGTAEKALLQEFGEDTNRRFLDQLLLINSHYQAVEKGDRYTLEFHPQTGLTLSFNDEQVTQLSDPEFGHYYLHVWLGSNDIAKPIQKRLKKNV